MIEKLTNFPGVTNAHIEACIRWFDKLCEEERWNLAQTEKLILLGGISLAKYENLLVGNLDDFPTSEKDKVIERLSILINIFEYTHALIGTDFAYSLFSKPNFHEVFSGKSIKEMLLANNSIEQFYIVRKYLVETAHY